MIMAILLGAKVWTREVYDIVDTAGEQVPTFVSSSTFQGSFQPIAGRERQDLPELYRARQVAKLFTQPTTVLRSVAVPELDTDTPGSTDILVDRYGRRWEVIREYDWTYHDAATKHRKYLIAEIGNDGVI